MINESIKSKSEQNFSANLQQKINSIFEENGIDSLVALEYDFKGEEEISAIRYFIEFYKWLRFLEVENFHLSLHKSMMQIADLLFKSAVGFEGIRIRSAWRKAIMKKEGLVYLQFPLIINVYSSLGANYFFRDQLVYEFDSSNPILSEEFKRNLELIEKELSVETFPFLEVVMSPECWNSLCVELISEV